MVSISPIGSQISFGRKKQDGESAKTGRPMITWRDKGGKKTPEQKYDGVEINETTAPIIYKDAYLDKAIEAALAGTTFLVATLKGKKILHGATGGFVDATKQLVKNGKTADSITGAAKRYFTTVGDAMKTAKASQVKAGKISDALEANKALNANSVVLKGSIIDKLANRADDEGSIVSSIANSKPVKEMILGSKKNIEDIKVDSGNVKTFLAKKGLTRGADIVDIGAAGAGAYGLSIGGRDVADIITDLNDDNVAEEAKKADIAAVEKQFGKKAGRLAKAGFDLYGML